MLRVAALGVESFELCPRQVLAVGVQGAVERSS